MGMGDKKNWTKGEQNILPQNTLVWHENYFERKQLRRSRYRDFPGSPVVKTSPSNPGSEGSVPGWGAKISHALQPKQKNRSNIVTGSIRTLKVVHIKKKIWTKKKQIQEKLSALPHLPKNRI